MLQVWLEPSEYQLNYGRANWTIGVHPLVTADLLSTWATSNQVEREEMHSHVGNSASIRGSLKILIIQDGCLLGMCLNMFHLERYKTQISDQRTSNHNADSNKPNCPTDFESRVNPSFSSNLARILFYERHFYQGGNCDLARLGNLPSVS